MDDPAPPGDDGLAERARRGDTAAWDALARRHMRRVVVALLAHGLRLDTAEDLAQEAWLRLLERQRAGRLRELILPGLAIAQARLLAAESVRTAARHRRLALAGGVGILGAFDANGIDRAPGPAEQAEDRERLAVVERALAGCPARAREIFVAVYGRAARPPAEVATELGLSVQRVRQSLCETRAQLRRALREREGEGDLR